MRMLSALIFDDVIAGTGTWYSSSELNNTIGAAETIVIQACTTGVASGSELTVQCESSPDNQNWDPTGGAGSPTPEIDGVAIDDDDSIVAAVTDLALLSHVRFKITLGAAGHKCRLKLYVTGRVAGGVSAGTS
jgi:hypothetical protein